MSIDARIERVTRESDGTAKLHLGQRDKYSTPGQKALTVLNPANGIEMLAGECIWGNSSTIMLGSTKIATRKSYCEIEMVGGKR